MTKKIHPDSRNNLERVFIQDSSSTTGEGLTGLAHDSAGLICGAYREDVGASTVTLAPMTVGSWVSGGFVEVSAANLPGVYEFGIPDSLCFNGSDSLELMFHGAANVVPTPLRLGFHLRNDVMYDGPISSWSSDTRLILDSDLAPTQAGTYPPGTIVVLRHTTQNPIRMFSTFSLVYTGAARALDIALPGPSPQSYDWVTLIACPAIKPFNPNEYRILADDQGRVKTTDVTNDGRVYSGLASPQFGFPSPTNLAFVLDGTVPPNDEAFLNCFAVFVSGTGEIHVSPIINYISSIMEIQIAHPSNSWTIFDNTPVVIYPDASVKSKSKTDNQILLDSAGSVTAIGGGDNPTTLFTGTVTAVETNQVELTLSSGPTNDDATSRQSFLILTKQGTTEQLDTVEVMGWDAATNKATLRKQPAFQVSPNDSYSWIANPPVGVQDAHLVSSQINVELIALGAKKNFIGFTRGSYVEFPISIGNITGQTKVVLTIKEGNELADSQSEIQIELTGATTQILVAGKGKPDAPSNGSIEVVNELNGDLIVKWEAVECAKVVTSNSLLFDFAWWDSQGKKRTPVKGTADSQWNATVTTTGA